MNARDRLCETPLFAASLKARANLVKILLDSGAHPGLKDQEGRTVADRISPERVQGSPEGAAFAKIRTLLAGAANSKPAAVTEKDGCD